MQYLKTSSVGRTVGAYIAAFVMLFPTVATTISAQPYYGRHYQRTQPARVSISRAQTIALGYYPNYRLVGTKLVTFRGRTAYRVTLRSGNVRRIVFVDAFTGRIRQVQTRVMPRSYGGYRY